jgi:hypothetical protein
MNIDKPRCYYQACGINFNVARSGNQPNFHNTPIRNGDIATKPGIARSVDDSTVTNEDIEGPSSRIRV